MKRFQILIPDDLMRRLQREANRREMSVAEVVRRGIERQLEAAVEGDVAPRLPILDLGASLVSADEWREAANAR